MKNFIGFFLLLCCICVPVIPLKGAVSAEWIDRSSTIFFPPLPKLQLSATQSFSVFWWNFLILDGVSEHDGSQWAKVRSLCQKLKATPSELMLRAECETHPKEYLKIIQDWAWDVPLRKNFPSSVEIKNHFARTLTQISMVPSAAGLLDILRADPFEASKELRALAEKRMPIRFPRVNGYFYDAQTSRVIIPVQFAFPPTASDQTRAAVGFAFDWVLVGPHGSTLQNENRIREDMQRVGWVGVIVLGLFCFLLFRLRAARLIPFFAVVLFGTALGALATKVLFGSIHGLTLSFGAAMMGLSMDYAFQAALNSKEPNIWKSNFCGFSTTLTGLVVLMFSSVPLLRQMMFFSVTGLIASYALLYALFKIFRFHAQTIHYEPRPNGPRFLISIFLLASAGWGIATLHPKLDLKQFDFQGPKEKEISLWLYQSMGLRAPLFEIYSPESALQKSHEEKKWALENQIQVENLANYLAPFSEQEAHLKSWNSNFKPQQILSGQEQKVFEPFLRGLVRQPISSTNLQWGPQRAYVRHLVNSDSAWISLWLPKSEAEESKIKTQFIGASSLAEVISVFPKTLATELAWMGPWSLLIAAFFHYLYYRKISYSLVALLPFFTGFGLVVLAKIIFGFELSFISVMGLILVFGFSLDYGIFATDASLFSGRRGMWPGILLAAISTVAGFVPLVFCEHPVLKDLGFTLFFGGLGTFWGAAYAIPPVMNFLIAWQQNPLDGGKS